MNFVEPIRSTEKIAQIKNLLKSRGRYRDLLLFTVGINTALRASDLLSLRIGDFVDNEGHIRSRFWIREVKGNKRNEVIINDSITQALLPYQVTYPDVEADPKCFAFFNIKTKDYNRPINRKHA